MARSDAQYFYEKHRKDIRIIEEPAKQTSSVFSIHHKQKGNMKMRRQETKPRHSGIDLGMGIIREGKRQHIRLE